MISIVIRPENALKMSLALSLILSWFISVQAQKPREERQHTIKVSVSTPLPTRLQVPVVEPSLAVHPQNPDHILVAAMAIMDQDRPYESAQLVTFLTTDQGKNWEEKIWNYWGYDPWVTIMPDGHTTLAWLGTAGAFQHAFPLQFFRSSDGGKTWNSNVQQMDNIHGHDGTKVVHDHEQFIATTVRFNGDMSADVAIYRATPDHPFQEVTKVPGRGLRLNFCEPAILSDGTTIIPSSEFRRKLWIQKLESDSTHLSRRTMVTLQPGGARGYMRLIHDDNKDSKWLDRLYFIRALYTGGVWINYSSDSGDSWSTDVRIDSFHTGLPSKANLASADVSEDGTLGITWIDSQNDPAQKSNDLYFSFSRDGGLTFSHPIKITEISSDPATPENGDVANKFSGGGHYMDIKSAGENTFVAVWSDSSTGIFQLQTCKIEINSS